MAKDLDALNTESLRGPHPDIQLLSPNMIYCLWPSHDGAGECIGPCTTSVQKNDDYIETSNHNICKNTGFYETLLTSIPHGAFLLEEN
jgi:hypothetical protein